MVAQATLTRLVLVRIQAGQPNCAAIWMFGLDENLGSTTLRRSGDGARASAIAKRLAAGQPIQAGQPFDSVLNPMKKIVALRALVQEGLDQGADYHAKAAGHWSNSTVIATPMSK